MNNKIRIQLSVMMFLQFVIWGAWYGQLSKYLFAINFTGAQVGNIYATFSIAMIISPFFIGMLADRFFAAQKVLGILNILGAVLLYALTQIKTYDTFYIVVAVGWFHFDALHRVHDFNVHIFLQTSPIPVKVTGERKEGKQ